MALEGELAVNWFDDFLEDADQQRRAEDIGLWNQGPGDDDKLRVTYISPVEAALGYAGSTVLPGAFAEGVTMDVPQGYGSPNLFNHLGRFGDFRYSER